MQYTGQEAYDLEVAGLKRRLPVVQVGENLWIASFVMLGDAELVNVCAANLAARLSGQDVDFLVGPEAKVLPLLQALATFMGLKRYVVCRKSVKAYMQDPLVQAVESITTQGVQQLVLDGIDVHRLRGRRVAVVDDVVSTGGSLTGVEALLKRAGAQVVCRAAVLKEGDFYQGDLVYLAYLPVFTQ
jgi:adenine phosphoribosyltransferase